MTSAFYYRKFGGGKATTGELFHVHDFIELSIRTQNRIFEKCSPLYEKGLSLRDIEELTGIAKNTVRNALQQNGTKLRDTSNGKNLPQDRHSFKKSGLPPYGFAYLDGKLVIDPKEHLVVRKIIKLHQKGRSMRAIAIELNGQKIANRKGTKWHHGVINSIISYQNKLNSHSTNRKIK